MVVFVFVQPPPPLFPFLLCLYRMEWHPPGTCVIGCMFFVPFSFCPFPFLLVTCCMPGNWYEIAPTRLFIVFFRLFSQPLSLSLALWSCFSFVWYDNGRRRNGTRTGKRAPSRGLTDRPSVRTDDGRNESWNLLEGRKGRAVGR